MNAAGNAATVCRAKSDGGRRCDTHLRQLTTAQLLPASRPDLPKLAWADDHHENPAQLYANQPRQAVNAALNTYLHARNHEPEMTDQLIAAVSAHSGTQLAGLSHRLKSPASLARKIGNKAYLHRRTPAQAAATLNDTIRYTITTRRPRDVIPTLTAIVDRLITQGWTLRGVKHSFVKGNPYKGIHLIMSSPGGQGCEIQFHTESALQRKEQTHLEYKIYRDTQLSPHQRQAAFDSCVDHWKGVPTPPELDTLTALGGADLVINDYRSKRPIPLREEGSA